MNVKNQVRVFTLLNTHSTQQPTLERIQSQGVVQLHTWQQRADVAINARARFDKAALTH